MIVKTHCKNPNAVNDLFLAIVPYLDLHFKPEIHMPVVLNIGTDRCTGDCLGPMVGWKLQEQKYKGLYLGDLEEPIHAENLSGSKRAIDKMASQKGKIPFIIAIDSALGLKSNIGFVLLDKGGFKPGEGVGKNVDFIGDISIRGIVGAKPPTIIPENIMDAVTISNLILANTRFYTVMCLSVVVSEFIIKLYQEYFQFRCR